MKTALDPAVLGPSHPVTRNLRLSWVIRLAAQGRVLEAVRLQEDMAPHLLTWLGTEFYGTEAPSLRRRLLRAQATYQDVAFSLALLPGAPQEAPELAAATALRFKDVAAEEEAFLGAIARRGETAAMRSLAAEVARLRTSLALLATAGAGPEFSTLARTLDARERALGQASRIYAQALRVRNASLAELRLVLGRMPEASALLELREYRLVNFRTASVSSEARWAGMLVMATGEVLVRDLGLIDTGELAVRLMLEAPDSEAAAAAGRTLYRQLLEPFGAKLGGTQRLYVAPDGVLYLTNIGLLHAEDGRRLLERKDVRIVQTGRDLLRLAPQQSARGLAAFGGIAFDRAALPVVDAATSLGSGSPAAPSARLEVPMDAERDRMRRGAAGTIRGRTFKPLPNSKMEGEAIATLYRRAREDEPAPVLLKGPDASKARLLALVPPRVLHLATHGFYWPSATPADHPLLLAGIALAGADQELQGGGQDGILYAIEAQDLRLEGTELVVLSACESGQGQLDYGGGISGLARALRTAGARYVLVSLRKVDDEKTARFMQLFYGHWLGQAGESGPAAALRATQRDYLTVHDNAAGDVQADETWTSFILIGG